MSIGKTSEMKVYVNGQFRSAGEATVSVFDHGFLYARLCTKSVKSMRVTGRLHQAVQIEPRDFQPVAIGCRC